jgi:hypothetical protein
VFESMCEFLVCRLLQRVYNGWTPVHYLKAWQKFIDADRAADVPEEKQKKVPWYIATELSEDGRRLKRILWDVRLRLILNRVIRPIEH